MAAIKRLLSQSHRQCFLKAPSPLINCHFLRPFSSSDQFPTPESESEQHRPGKSITLQPVSYKPKAPSEKLSEETLSEFQPPEQRDPKREFTEAQRWGKEDLRYLKDIPISTVSYPTRVAPLPEDRMSSKEGEQTESVNEELESERRKIEAQSLRRVLKVEGEKVPFPTFFKVEDNKKEKVVYDLKQAIQLVKIAKDLRRLMPDGKRGTVTKEMTNAVKKAREQGILFKKDRDALVHVGIGKLSFTEEALRENIGAFVNALLLAKPAGLKKSSKYAGYVNSFHICSTMGPSFPVSIQSLSIAADHYNRLQLQ